MIAPRPTENMPVPYPDAPTDNLAMVAGRIFEKHKSVTTQIEAQPGSAPTAPIMLTVSFAGQAVFTQQYSAWSGNRFIHHFPELDGMPRTWDVVVDLVEQKPTGNISYQRVFKLSIVPEFDVEVSPLSFTLLSDCDWVGDSEPVIVWYDPTNTMHEVELEMQGGDTEQVSGFSRFYQKATAYDGLVEPLVDWYEADFSGAYLYPSPSSTKLFPANNHTAAWDHKDPDCTGHLEYSVVFHLWRYPTL